MHVTTQFEHATVEYVRPQRLTISRNSAGQIYVGFCWCGFCKPDALKLTNRHYARTIEPGHRGDDGAERVLWSRDYTPLSIHCVAIIHGWRDCVGAFGGDLGV
jgi:hypothetical protein